MGSGQVSEGSLYSSILPKNTSRSKKQTARAICFILIPEPQCVGQDHQVWLGYQARQIGSYLLVALTAYTKRISPRIRNDQVLQPVEPLSLLEVVFIGGLIYDVFLE